MIVRRMEKNIFLCLIIWMTYWIFFSPVALCQYWTALPPYNTLWPLWSPALSPIDPITGLPTPTVTTLTPQIVLPVQPGLTWDPSKTYPWLLYNTPLGMIYFDAVFGINPWPPIGLVPPISGIPFVTTLPPDYSALPPTDPAWLLSNVPVANALYTNVYPFYSFIASSPFFLGFTLPPVPLVTFTAPLTTAISGFAPVIVPPVLSATAILGL